MSAPAVSERLTKNLQNFQVIDECWVWQGYRDRNGYGRVYDPSAKTVDWVHRVSYRVHTGEIPTGFEVDHVCRNTLCMNPSHLDAISKAEHVARTMDRLGKNDRHQLAAHLRGQHLTYEQIAVAMGLGSRSAAAAAVRAAIAKGLVSADDVPGARRLTDSEREDIRDLWALGVPQPVLAECYEVDDSHVSRICSGRSSGHDTRRTA